MSSEPSVVGGSPFPYPGTRPPERRRSVDSGGVRLAVYEWGEADAPPLLLVHGGFDFARTFDGFAPLLADAGYRVVSWDHRGHGDSAHAELYSWLADERDLLAVVETVSPEPFPVVGHSKGGSMLLHVSQALPHRFTRFAAVDGIPFRRAAPDVAEHERTLRMAAEISGWLDHRRATAGATRKPGTPDELAERRARMNPRLSHAWLKYLVGLGARQDADGWRWKIDPALRMGGFGPWRAQWAADRLPGFPIPMLAVFPTEHEPMGWGVDPEELRAFLPASARVEVFADTGHFIHIERPRETADLVLEFLRA